MKRSVKGLFLLFAIAAGLNLWAQNKKPTTQPAEKADSKVKSGDQPRKIFLPTVYLGKSDFCGGNISVTQFSQLLRQGLSSRDSLGNKYKVVGFDFNYFERGYFEDSIGNLKVMTEVLYEYCPGDTITRNVSASIYERIKPGDTVLIGRVNVAKISSHKGGKPQPESEAIAAKGIKCVITK